MVIVASEVTTLNPLDLDHARAEVRKLPGSERCGDGPLQTDDNDDHTLWGAAHRWVVGMLGRRWPRSSLPRRLIGDANNK
jgi:hypothetical protein